MNRKDDLWSTEYGQNKKKTDNKPRKFMLLLVGVTIISFALNNMIYENTTTFDVYSVNNKKKTFIVVDVESNSTNIMMYRIVNKSPFDIIIEIIKPNNRNIVFSTNYNNTIILSGKSEWIEIKIENNSDKVIECSVNIKGKKV